ncbi:hypothetical protein C0992_001122 [Termitomyces sp. T32_za158]|nr:hypothetical protein C0992_001122 [Termitomyces sp. T32_za158]
MAQEVLLYHHLALQTSRVYAYQPIVWRPRGPEATVPLSAFMLGVARNSISSSVFDEVCSPEETRHVAIRVSHPTLWEYAKGQLSGDEKCIVVDDKILGWDYLASPALHEIWPEFQKYLRHHFQWSDAIQTIAQRAQKYLNLRPSQSVDEGDPYIALHFRRGKYSLNSYSTSLSTSVQGTLKITVKSSQSAKQASQPGPPSPLSNPPSFRPPSTQQTTPP